MSGGENIGDIPGLSIILTIMCVIAVLLNIIVIIVVSTKTCARTSVDGFIINLCVSDILLAGIALPLRLNNGSHEGESFKGGDHVCKVMMFVPLLTISTSIYTMVAIAIDRTREIIYGKKLTLQEARKIIFGIWLWSIATSSPQIYEYSAYVKYDEEYNITSCGSHDIVENFETIYASVVIVISYVIPLVLITINYARIIIFVWKAGNTLAAIESQVLKKRMRIVRLLITVTVVFALLWSPYFVLFGMEEALGLDDTMHTGSGKHITKNVFVVLSTLSNPVIFFISDSRFRRDLVCLLTGRRCTQVNSNRVHPRTEGGNEVRGSHGNGSAMKTYVVS